MSASNNRASLLSGLRTGGVRSASGPIMPHTAAVNGSFQVPRFASSYQPKSAYDDGGDDLGQTLQYGNMNHYGVPMTASHIDSRAPRFQQATMQQQQHQQQQQMFRQAQIAALSGMQGVNPMDQAQAQFLQLQLMQAMVAQQQQAQKLQAEIALQQQVALALASQQAPRHHNGNSRAPMTAAPTQTSFDLRPNPLSQLRNSRMAAVEENEEVGPMPMTAALGGKFGSRSLPTGLNPHAPTFKISDTDHSQPPPTPSTTVVISGGVSLGGPAAPTSTSTSSVVPSKSDSAVSWRRGSAPGLTTTNARSVSPPKPIQRQSPPAVTISSPEQVEKESPVVSAPPVPKFRPQPLRINGGSLPTVPAVTIEDEEGHTVFSSNTAVVNPPSPASSQSSLEGAKKYEGLGLGRPVVNNSQSTPAVRLIQPVRQPRGPPAGAEDLGLKNFAARVKRTASVPMMIAQDAVVIEAY